jgi:tetratricopeptide (TPR) repeat protein
MESEWAKLDELYQIGKKPQVSLLIKSSSGRVYELLRPCPLYVSDEKPRDIPEVFETAVRKIEEALKTGDISKHLEAIRLLETMVNRYPNPRYNPQFLLYIGSYYEYIGMHQKAIDSFERVVRLYPDSQYASLALAAQGVIYEAKIGDIYLADKTYKKILKDYPNSLEAILAEEKLGIKKVS